MGGHDLIFTGPSDTWLWGGGGNDQLFSANPTGSLIGHDGHDRLEGTTPSFGGQSLFGGPDNDCLGIDRPLVPESPAAYDCGPGNDVDLNSPPNNINCERPSAGCTQKALRRVPETTVPSSSTRPASSDRCESVPMRPPAAASCSARTAA
jgi:hypothetical protein